VRLTQEIYGKSKLAAKRYHCVVDSKLSSLYEKGSLNWENCHTGWGY